MERVFGAGFDAAFAAVSCGFAPAAVGNAVFALIDVNLGLVAIRVAAPRLLVNVGVVGTRAAIASIA